MPILDNTTKGKLQTTTSRDLAEQLVDIRKAVLESVSKSMYPITEWKKSIESVMEKQAQYQKDLYGQINPLVELQKRLSGEIKDAVESVQKAFSKIDFGGLRDISQQLIDEGIRLDVLIKTGWWYCPSMLNIGSQEIKKAALDYKKGKRQAMTNLILSSYHQDNYDLLRKTTDGWKNNPLFAKRYNVIKDALDAHIKGKYTLSIPTLLPLVEGIAGEYCKNNKINTTAFRSKGSKKVESAFERLMKDSGHPFKFPDLFLDVLNTVIYEDTARITDPFRKKLNRNGVLHGTYIKYYDAPRSLRCFLLLDAVSALR